jgi:hypothetical protein
MVRRQGGRRLGTVWFFVVEEVVKIRDGVVIDGGGWFEERIKRKVCNVVDTIFGIDLWLCGVPL